MKRVSLPIKNSVCTEDPDQIVHGWEDGAVKNVENTGIEREGGITNLYREETTFATAGVQSVYTRSGDLLQVDAAHNVRVNDASIGNVGSLAVTQRGAIPGYSDAAWTATNTIIGIVKVGSTIRVDEYNPATGAVINSRSTTFTMPSVTITNVALVKYVGMAYSDNLQFILSNNRASYVLSESGTTTQLVGGITLSTRTLTAKTWSGLAWSPRLNMFCATSVDGASSYYATSADGITWSSGALASGYWYSVCWSPELSRFVAVSEATNYAATSDNGTSWTVRTLTAKPWYSVCWAPQLGIFCAVSGGGASAFYATSADGITWSSGALATGTWFSVCWSPELSLFVTVGQGATNYVATSPDGSTWTPQTLAAKDWRGVAWSPLLGIFCAVSHDGASSSYATSSNGVSWSTGSMPSGDWNDIKWVPQLSAFIAVGATTNYCAISTNGTAWSIMSLAANTWNRVAWAPEISTIAAVGAGATNYAASGTSNINSSTFCWKFYASNYLIGAQGQSGKWYIGDIAGTPTAITDATWAVIDQFAGTAYSRAILTFNVKKNAANLLTGIGEVGYNQAGTYSATPTYYGVALGAVTVTFGTVGGATINNSGPGWAEATFTRSDTGTNIYQYTAPIMGHLPGLWYDYQQSQTHTFANGYGRLTDFVGNTLGNVCSLRVPMVNQQPSLISAGVLGAENTLPMDALGVPLTNVGEFDETFVPHVVDNGSSRVNVIYRYNGVLFHLSVGTGATSRIQRVSDNVYLINTISPVNCVDVASRTMTLGVNDYNGRLLLRSTGAIGTSSTKAVGVMQGLHVNSIDTGDKLITQTFSATTNLVPGIELPSFVDRAVPDFGVNIYLQDVYSTTYQAVNVTAAKGDLANTLYVSDTRVPFGMGYTFMATVMQTEVETIFGGVGALGSADVDYDYLCYELGNQVSGQYQAFRLFGQTYLFDGKSIYLATFTGPSYGGKDAPLAPATGMTLIATAPTMVFFLSAFDNSIYTFDGGRSLTKFHRMNKTGAVTQGVYNVRDNTLLLDATNDLIWIRDNIITVNPKDAAQLASALGLYDTENGIYLGNATTSWKYNFTATGTIVPVAFQTGFFGGIQSTRDVVSRYLLTFYSSAKAAMVITVTYNAFDQDDSYTQTEYFPVQPSDYTPDGMLRLKFIPQQALMMAASIGVQWASKLTLLDITAEYSEQSDATIATSRSR